MFHYGLAAASLVLCLTPSIQAHMLLYKPTPFASGDMPDNGPITTNYPCKSVNGKDANGGDAYAFSFPRTEMPIGSNYTVQFQGQSVHGGGSCQFSLTKDLAPNTGSEFKVIHTIEGGCPARNQAGNLGGDSSATAIDPYTYPIPIPELVEPGQYTFAWTWFNKVGNREMYMGCAPVAITGNGASSPAAFDALPDLFLANIPAVKCSSPIDESVEMKFPDPGTSLQIESSDGLQPPTGDVSQCYAPIGKPHNSSSGAAPYPAKAPAPTASQVYSPVAASPPATQANSSSTPVASTSQAPTSASSDPATTSPSIGGGSGSGGSYGECPSGAQPCSIDGSVVCIGSTKFGLCNFGCAVAQDLASGTTCANGAISKRVYVPPQARIHERVSIEDS